MPMMDVLIKYPKWKAHRQRPQNWASPTTLEDLKIGRHCAVNLWGIVDMFDLQSTLLFIGIAFSPGNQRHTLAPRCSICHFLSSAEQVEVPALRSRHQRREWRQKLWPLWPLCPLWPCHSKAPDTRDMSELYAASRPSSLHERHGDPCRVPKRSHEMQQSLTDKWHNLWHRFCHWRYQDRIWFERSYLPTRPDLPRDALTMRWANNIGLLGRKAASRPRCWQLALSYNCLPVAAWWGWLLAKSLQTAPWRLQSCRASKRLGCGKLHHPASLWESPQN